MLKINRNQSTSNNFNVNKPISVSDPLKDHSFSPRAAWFSANIFGESLCLITGAAILSMVVDGCDRTLLQATMPKVPANTAVEKFEGLEVSLPVEYKKP